jgi:elongation factor Ts
MEITSEMVKALREKTNSSMMECRKALVEANGDFTKAEEILRVRGLSIADRKSGRTTTEGVIHAYIHTGNKLGVMVEVACETDFVARTDEFKDMVKDLAMHIAASAPLAVGREDISPEVLEAEKRVYEEQAKEAKKPEAMWEKIVGGKLEAFYKSSCLMEQEFVKDPAMTISDLVKGMIAKTGENIVVRRFIRYKLGD